MKSGNCGFDYMCHYRNYSLCTQIDSYQKVEVTRMPDIEKVIKALEHCVLPARKGWPYCSNIAGSCCESDDCPYYQDDCDQMLFDALALLKEHEPIIRCKDCKYYVVENHYVNFYECQVLAAPDVPTCHRWGDDVCMVRPDGHCYLAERR